MDKVNIADFYLTEESIIKNFSRLFNYKCDIIAKVLYLLMSGNKDCKVIYFIIFCETFLPLLVK